MSDEDENTVQLTEILVALDYSHHSQAALESAALMAKLLQANLRGIFVQDDQWLRISKLPFSSEIDELTGKITPMAEKSVERQIQALERRIKQHFEWISRQNQLSHSWRTVKGAVKEKVLEAAKEADLITIGSSGRSYSRQNKLGSTARAIVQEADKPVLILQKGIKLGTNILAVFDGSGQSRNCVKMALKIAAKNNSKAVILDFSDAFESVGERTKKLNEWVGDSVYVKKILKLEEPDMGKFLFLLDRQRSGLLVLPKSPRYIKRHNLELILESANSPVLLMT